MSPPRHVTSVADAAAQVQSLARPLHGPGDLDPLIEQVGAARFVCLGEASHGTHEFYRWRALLSRRLIVERGFTWIGVEGDWPDCWRINRWVRGLDEQDLDVDGLLARFARWPTWMWANRDVAEFLDWLHRWNLALPPADRVGFYGLDVYSLWDSLREIIAWLEANAPDAVPAAHRAWECFVPYREDPHEYAWSTRLVPLSCEPDVGALLAEVRGRMHEAAHDDEGAFDAAQNAEVAADAEHYYRIMVRGDRVIAGCRKPAQAHALNHLAGEHPGHLHVLPLDVASERSIAEFAREAALVADKVDVLINNAGLLVGGERFGELAAKTFVDSYVVNAVAPVLLIQAFAPLLRAAAPGAKVANLSSQMGSMADATSARSPSYSMSKAALNMATRRLAAELGTQGVTVAAFHPGWVRTDMGGAAATTPVEESAAALLQQIDGLTPAHNGGFFDRHGRAFPW